MYKKYSLLIAAAALSLIANAQSSKYTLERADSLFRNYKLDDSHNLYLRMANDPSYGATVRAKAYQKFAEQEWKFYKDYNSAVSTLRVAAVLKTDMYGINLL